MSKIKYRETKITKNNMKRLLLINSIVEEYQRIGLVLTLRQLYYQLVTRDVIPNVASEYAKLSRLLKEGRMAGIVDWDAIEDRLRQVEKASSWDGPEEIMDTVISQYRRDRREGQKTYVEVWVEKDALSGVLTRVTNPAGVPIMVNRGYSSASAMHDAWSRFRSKVLHEEFQRVRILYLGDFDPSGLDMIRDIEGRITEFYDGRGIYGKSFDFEIIPIALTREQIDTYNPPPNPAKLQDPRAGGFVEEHGYSSWEVDALNPETLDQIVRDAIAEFTDEDKAKEVLEQEEEERGKLRRLNDRIDEPDWKEEVYDKDFRSDSHYAWMNEAPDISTEDESTESVWQAAIEWFVENKLS